MHQRRFAPCTRRSTRKGKERTAWWTPKLAPLKENVPQHYSTGPASTNLLQQIPKYNYECKKPLYLRWCRLHCENGSPTKPDRHTHIGVWLTTLHSAFAPQLPGHGSRHFWFMQAR